MMYFKHSLLSIVRIGRTVPFPSKRPPLPRKRDWYDAVTAHWASHKNKRPFNGAWSKLYFNQKPGDPTPEALVAVRRFTQRQGCDTSGGQPRREGVVVPLWGAEIGELTDEPNCATLSAGEVASDTSHPSNRPSQSEVASDTSPREARRPASVAASASRASHRGDNQNAWQ